jgi:hypothetical protein
MNPPDTIALLPAVHLLSASPFDGKGKSVPKIGAPTSLIRSLRMSFEQILHRFSADVKGQFVA